MLARIEYICYKVFKFLVLILPRKLRYHLASLLGLILYYTVAKRRKIAINNIKQHLGYTEEEAKRLAKQVFKDVSFKFSEIITFSAWRDKDFNDRIKVEGLDRLEKVYNNNRPAIIFTGHLGNWELMGLYLARSGLPINAVARKQSNQYIYDEIQEIRMTYGGDVINKNDARNIYKKLLKKEFMVILGDQNKRSGVFIDFLGSKASTARGPVYLAKKTGAVIIPVYMIRDGLQYELIVGEDIEIPKEASEAEELQYLQQLHDDLAQMVTAYPKQWLWLHRRWKTRPAEEA